MTAGREFVKRWSSLSEAMEWDPPPEEHVDRVMTAVRPAEEDFKACLRDVVDSLNIIAHGVPDLVPPGALRKRLLRRAKALANVVQSDRELPAGERLPNAFTEQIKMHRRLSEQQADRLKPQPTGGGTEKDKAFHVKVLAAERAFDLLNESGRREPKLSQDGEFLSLTALLYELGAGLKEVDAEQVKRACKQVFENLEAGGYPDAAKRREDRKSMKQAGKSAPSWLLERLAARGGATRKK